MLTEEMLRVIEAAQLAFVASADETGCPHLGSAHETEIIVR
jgi:predicted pyridoxine 5'-phosphate oxidase superfamily flavin-nucleotide-binding protein